MVTKRRLNQMERKDLIEYIRDLEEQVRAYEDAQDDAILDFDDGEVEEEVRRYLDDEDYQPDTPPVRYHDYD